MLLFFGQLKSIAQRDSTIGTIAGNIVDENTLRAIEGATCTIFLLNDTSKKRSQVSDADGGFNFEKLPFGHYGIRVSFLGYRRIAIDSLYLRSERNDFNLPDLKLSKSATNLTEVVVYAEKPLIEHKDGKIVFNSSESALSNSASTTELLKQTPLVSVDESGKVQMRGKEVKILIDDKPVELNAQQLQDLLESMPGSMIEKIEVLTTPPPQYATERGGVINIVTKKGKVGINGRININYGTRGEYGTSGNFSYRKNKVSLSVNTSFSDNEYAGNSYSRRVNRYIDSTNRFNTNSKSSSEVFRQNYRIAFDYELNKRNAFSITGSFNANKNNGGSSTYYSNINRFDSLYKLSNRDVTTAAHVLNPSVSGSYTHKGKNAAEVLRIVTSFTDTRNETGRDFYQQYLNMDSSSSGSDSTQFQDLNVGTKVTSLRVSYDKPQGKKWYLGIGGNAGWYRTANDVRSYYLKKPDLVYAPIFAMSNLFDFFQNVYSLRASARYQLKTDIFITVGLHQEYSQTWFEIKDSANAFRNNYSSALPFANISAKWKEKYSLTVSYKRTVQRPSIGNLNPTIDYTDPYNIRFGNPLLQPYYAHNIDLIIGYTKKQFSINFSVGFNSLQQMFSIIRTLQPDGKTNSTWQNLSGRDEYEASIWSNVNISKKFKLNASASYVYNKYSEHDITFNRYVNGGNFNSSVNGNYVVSPLVNFTANVTYNRFANPQGRVRNAVSNNIGLQRKFLNKKLNISISIVDPFKNQQNRNFTYGPNYDLESYSQTRSRNFRIAAAYTISKTAKKRKAATSPLKPNLPKTQKPLPKTSAKG